MVRRFARYICTPETFRPVEHRQVRWLDWDSDWPLAQSIWTASKYDFSKTDWLGARDAGYRYAALIIDGSIVAHAAIWSYSDKAWEAAAVGTLCDFRRKGYGSAVVSFVTAQILTAGRTATCTTLEDNAPMRGVAEKLGYTFRDIQELTVEE